MAKAKNPRRLKETEALAIATHIRTSPRKLNLIAGMIRGKACGSALADLEFSHRRVAKEVKKLLESAIANAENNHQLDVDKLIVSEATVGKTLKIKRWHARARGRAGRIEKPFSNMRIIVRERTEQV